MQDNDINKEVESGEVNAEALNTEEIVQKKEKKNFKYLQGFLSGFCFFAFTFFVINLVFNVLLCGISVISFVFIFHSIVI